MKHWKRFSIDIAEVLDALRVFPRLFVVLYIYGLAHVLYWATSLADISVQQAAFISVVSGTFPFVLNFYMQTGRDWSTQQRGVDYVSVGSVITSSQSSGNIVGTGGDRRTIPGPMELRTEVQGSSSGVGSQPKASE